MHPDIYPFVKLCVYLYGFCILAGSTSIFICGILFLIVIYHITEYRLRNILLQYRELLPPEEQLKFDKMPSDVQRKQLDEHEREYPSEVTLIIK